MCLAQESILMTCPEVRTSKEEKIMSEKQKIEDQKGSSKKRSKMPVIAGILAVIVAVLILCIVLVACKGSRKQTVESLEDRFCCSVRFQEERELCRRGD